MGLGGLQDKADAAHVMRGWGPVAVVVSVLVAALWSPKPQPLSSLLLVLLLLLLHLLLLIRLLGHATLQESQSVRCLL